MSNRILFTIIFLPFCFACTSERLSTRAASQRLKPVQLLPERDQRQIPPNLIITIKNVANSTSSYKNYIQLFINGKEIAPESQENNLKSTYRYSFTLQSGMYKIEAKYHAVGLWRKRVFEIRTDEPIKVRHGMRTELSLSLDKDSRGFPRQKRSLFNVDYRPFVQAQMRENNADAIVQRQAPLQAMDIRNKNVKTGRTTGTAKTLGTEAVSVRDFSNEDTQQVRSLAKLQINTIPLGADVYIDDKFVGQSPLQIEVLNHKEHIVQIAKDGYRDYLKVLTSSELREQQSHRLIIRLDDK